MLRHHIPAAGCHWKFGIFGLKDPGDWSSQTENNKNKNCLKIGTFKNCTVCFFSV